MDSAAVVKTGRLLRLAWAAASAPTLWRVVQSAPERRDVVDAVAEPFAHAASKLSEESLNELVQLVCGGGDAAEAQPLSTAACAALGWLREKAALGSGPQILLCALSSAEKEVRIKAYNAMLWAGPTLVKREPALLDACCDVILAPDEDSHVDEIEDIGALELDRGETGKDHDVDVIRGRMDEDERRLATALLVRQVRPPLWPVIQTDASIACDTYPLRLSVDDRNPPTAIGKWSPDCLPKSTAPITGTTLVRRS